jgi:hypothetical protein
MAEEGYQEFSIELEQVLGEQEAWKGSKQFNEVLIKKACEHSDCPHTRCAKSLRISTHEKPAGHNYYHPRARRHSCSKRCADESLHAQDVFQMRRMRLPERKTSNALQSLRARIECLNPARKLALIMCDRPHCKPKERGGIVLPITDSKPAPYPLSSRIIARAQSPAAIDDRM